MTDISIDAADGSGKFGAYVAAPKGTGKVPGMLVIQEIFGINDTVRAICDDYASRGYLAVAPDLFWRQEPNVQLSSGTKEGWAKAMTLFQGFSETKGIEDLMTTLAWLRGQSRLNGKAGAVGYCLGGKLAYLMATRSNSDATVGYYGVMIDRSLDEASAITKPLMLHVAEKDSFSSAEAQEKIRDALSKVTYVTLHTYPGADHAFARKGGEHYDPAAAPLADGRTAQFFEHHLKGPA